MNLDRYFDRIGYHGPTEPTAEVLAGLHLAHATSIPFENLDIFLGRPILLELAHLEDKLVGSRRGGYCFEHNTLLAAALTELGFGVTPLAARVRPAPGVVLPRTHMVLQVETEDGAWLADVGFGDGVLEPVPMVAGEQQAQFGTFYRLAVEGPALVLQRRAGGSWQDLYAFTAEPQEPVDYVVANHYVSTHPDSAFVRRIIVMCSREHERRSLLGRELTVTSGGHAHTTTVGDDELLDVLLDQFGIELPAGAELRPPYPD